jgi:hypothetical protein
VSSHVCFEGAWSHKTKAANGARERSFARVAPLVISKMSVSRKWYLTNVTLIGFYPFMNAIMDLKITALSEKFAANLAFKRLYALVCSNMNLQSTSPGVCFFTEWTFER